MCQGARGAASALKSQMRVCLRRPGRTPDPLAGGDPRTPQTPKREVPPAVGPRQGANGGGLSSSSGACRGGAEAPVWRRQMSSREKEVVVVMFCADDAPREFLMMKHGARDGALVHDRR